MILEEQAQEQTATQEPPEQQLPPPWHDRLKVTVNVLRNKKAEHDVTVTFTVNEGREPQVRDIIGNFLRELPTTAKVTVKTADDSETRKPVWIFIDVDSFGSQQQVAGRLQQYAQVILPNCAEVV